MSPDREPPEQDEVEREPYEESQRRTMFATTWFRAVVVVVVLGVVAAVAVPYVLETMSPPTPVVRPPGTAKAPPPAPPAPVVTPTPTSPALDVAAAPAAEKKEMANPVLTPPPRSAAPPKTETAAPAPPRASEAARPETRRKPAPKKTAEARPAAKAEPATTVGGESGGWWVQVGAFRDPAAAKRIAAELRGAQFRVEESVTRIGEAGAAPAPAPRAQPGPDRYDVLVSGGSPADLNARLAGKGLAAEPAGGGVAIRPSLPLRDAVALSKDLAADGLKVQVKRATGDGAAGPARAPAPAGGGSVTLHRVRVGAFADRAAAQSAARDLEARGYKPFIAR
jgi:cell division septation protein DedD